MTSEPHYPAMKLLQLAFDSLHKGRLAEAEARFRQVLTHQPSNVLALTRLSSLAFDGGRTDEACQLLQRALQVEPDNLQLLGFHGLMLHETGRSREALDVFLRMLAIDSSNAEIWNAAGVCFQETDQPVSATEFYLKAISLRPGYAEAHNNLGVVLLHEGDNTSATEQFTTALQLDPSYADAYSNLGVAQRNRLHYTAAIKAFHEALRLSPRNADATGGLGEVLSLIYDDAAESTLRHAVKLSPSNAEKHWNLALELLKRGDYLAGWEEYEWRWKRPGNKNPLRPLQQPFWLGEPEQELRGTTILLHAEQGFGDTLQFLRYVPLLLARGASVVLEVQPALTRLATQYAAQFSGDVSVVAAGDTLPHFDWHTPMMSLPRAFRTTLDTVPPPRRFTPPPAEPRPSNQPLRIGLAWAGNSQHDRDRERSIPAEALLPLLRNTGHTWVSLQVGPAADQLQRTGITTVEYPKLADFADTAAVLDTLDVVLSVDTAVAHLAASQGVPTWILLPFVADWRWLRPSHTAPNPWYPAARIFRQTGFPDGRSQQELWQPVLASIEHTLRDCIESLHPANTQA